MPTDPSPEHSPDHSPETLERQHERHYLLSEIIIKIRQSLDINEILKTAVTEVKQSLQVDRVLVFKLESKGMGTVVQEAVHDRQTATLGFDLFDPCLVNCIEQYRQGRISAIEDIDRAGIEPCHVEFLKQFGVKANLVVPILQQDTLWGLLIAHQCDRPRRWTEGETEFLRPVAAQIGIAVAQSQLLHELEQQLEARTIELLAANRQLQREIEERHRAERSLRESEERFRTLVDNIPGAVYRCLFDRYLTALFLSDAILDISGYASADFIHNQVLTFISIIHADDVERVMQEIRDAVVERRPYQIVYRVVGRDRRIRWVVDDGQGIFSTKHSHQSANQTGELLYLDGAIFDITEQRQAQLAVQTSAAQLRLITDNLPALIAYVDNQQRYQFVNETYEAWHGIPQSDIIGLPVYDLLGEDLYQQTKPAIEQALSGERARVEIKVILKDRQVRDIDGIYVPNIDAEGTVYGFFFLGNDVSQQKEIERLKDEFISVVSHELRTPLTSIYGSLKLLKTTTESTFSKDDIGLLNIAVNSSKRLIRLVNDILDLERIESGKVTLTKQACNAAEMLSQAADIMIAQAYPQGITIKARQESIIVWADPDRIHRTLTNLLSNAIRFSPEGATIWLGAEERNREIVFFVKDQGRGIPADKLENIFDRFQQVDASDSREKEGTGLGLSICQNIVHLHGGRIWVESVLGQGSTFYFTLPKVNPT